MEFPADWYRAFASELAPVLTEMYNDCLEDGSLTPLMRSAVTSLIYKQKGSRTDLSKYRPVTVTAAEYKILTKSMQMALNDVLHFVIGPTQLGFQKGKYIGEATALAQLVTACCEKKDTPGLLLLHDRTVN